MAHKACRRQELAARIGHGRAMWLTMAFSMAEMNHEPDIYRARHGFAFELAFKNYHGTSREHGKQKHYCILSRQKQH